MAPKKAPAFYTDVDDLSPYGVKANDLVTTPLGLTAAVLGVKYAKKDDPESSSLWVEHRCEFQSPIEEELFQELNSMTDQFSDYPFFGFMFLARTQIPAVRRYKRCPDGASIWRDIMKLEKIVQEDDEERALVQELNRQYQEQLAAEEAKKTKKKKAPEPAAEQLAAEPAAAQPVA